MLKSRVQAEDGDHTARLDPAEEEARHPVDEEGAEGQRDEPAGDEAGEPKAEESDRQRVQQGRNRTIAVRKIAVRPLAFTELAGRREIVAGVADRVPPLEPGQAGEFEDEHDEGSEGER